MRCARCAARDALRAMRNSYTLVCYYLLLVYTKQMGTMMATIPTKGQHISFSPSLSPSLLQRRTAPRRVHIHKKHLLNPIG
jgi:hypothetical protein